MSHAICVKLRALQIQITSVCFDKKWVATWWASYRESTQRIVDCGYVCLSVSVSSIKESYLIKQQDIWKIIDEEKRHKERQAIVALAVCWRYVFRDFPEESGRVHQRASASDRKRLRPPPYLDTARTCAILSSYLKNDSKCNCFGNQRKKGRSNGLVHKLINKAESRRRQYDKREVKVGIMNGSSCDWQSRRTLFFLLKNSP